MRGHFGEVRVREGQQEIHARVHDARVHVHEVAVSRYAAAARRASSLPTVAYKDVSQGPPVKLVRRPRFRDPSLW